MERERQNIAYNALAKFTPRGYITNFKPIRICFAIFRIFIKIGLMGRIWIDFALLNTFATCDFYRCLEIFTFSWKLDINKVLNRALYGNYIAMPIPLWCPIDCRSIASQLITPSQPQGASERSFLTNQPQGACERRIGKAIQLPYRALFNTLLMSNFQEKIKSQKIDKKHNSQMCSGAQNRFKSNPSTQCW